MPVNLSIEYITNKQATGTVILLVNAGLIESAISCIE